MKHCEGCRFLDSGYYGEGICQFFGDDCPDWAENRTDGCLLKYQEVKKLVHLKEEIMDLNYAYPRNIDVVREEREIQEKMDNLSNEYDNYINVVKKRCKEREAKQ